MRGRHATPGQPSATAALPIRPRRLTALVALTLAVALVAVLLVAAEARSASIPLYRPVDAVRVLKGTDLAARGSATIPLPAPPAGATHVALRVTALPVAGAAILSACPGESAGCDSSADFATGTGHTTSTLTVPVRTAPAAVTLSSSAATRVWVDLVGYTIDASVSSAAVDSRFQPLDPRRVATVTLSGRGTTTVTIPDVPPGATAVSLRATTAEGATSTNVAACAAGSSSVCNGTTFVNPNQGLARQAAGVVPLGPGGALQLFNLGGDVTLSLDVDGFYLRRDASMDGGLVSPTTEALTSFVVRPGGTATLSLDPPADAIAVQLRVRATGAWRPTVVSLCPGAEPTADCRQTALLTASPDAVAYGDAIVPLDPAEPETITVLNSAASVRLTPEVTGWVIGTAPSASPTTAPPTSASPTPTPTPKPTASPSATPKPTASPSPTAKPTAEPSPTTAPPKDTAPRPGGKPGPANTGVPAGTKLTVHNGDLTITQDGTVVDGLDIRGFVDVRAANVVVRNSIVRGYGVTSSKGLIRNSGAGHLLVEDTEVFAGTPSYWIDGVRGYNMTLRRVDIHNVTDSVRVLGDNVRIEASWLHDNLHYTSVPDQTNGSHDDSIQIQKGSNLRFVGNNISGAYNAAVMFSPGLGPISDAAFTGNWIDGGGCSVNIAEQGRGPMQGLVFRDNVFGRTTRVKNCAILAPLTTVPLLSGNTFTDGAVVSVSKG